MYVSLCNYCYRCLYILVYLFIACVHQRECDQVNPFKKIMPPLRKFSLESKTPRHILSSLSTFTNVDLVTKDQRNLIIEQEAEYNESFDDHKSLVKKNQ